MFSPSFSRRALLAGGAALLAAPAAAELVIDLRGGAFKPLPIAILDFEGEQASAAQVGSVIANNLRRCGLFQVLDKASYPEKAIGFDSQPQFPIWQPTGALGIVTGRVMKDGARVKAEFRLWDVAAQQQLVANQYTADPRFWRRISHLVSDAIFTRLTGETGFFDTRVVFIDETGPKQKRIKRLAIMDQDGANFRVIGGGDSLVTPRFSPSGQQIAYMAFGDDDPRVFLLDIASGQRQVLGDFPGMSFAPRFSPDGRKVVMSQQDGGNANIFVLDIGSRLSFNLTDST